MGKTDLIAEPGKQEFTVTRVVDAPPELVFKAHTDPALLARWLRPKGYTMTVNEMDARAGGSWRFVHSDREGHAYGFHGVHHTVTPGRIDRTFEFEGWPGHVSLETLTLAAQDGKTKMTVHAVYQSVADRDGMIASDMEEGMSESFSLLDALLKELQLP